MMAAEMINAVELDRRIVMATQAGLPLCATEEQLAGYPNLEPIEECEQQRASG